MFIQRFDLNRWLALLIPLTFLFLGCVSQPGAPGSVALTVEPIIDYYPLGGFVEKRGEALYALSGSISQVKKELEDIVVNGAPIRDTFSTDESLNLVVFRGVFNTGGYGIEIDGLEITDNTLVIRATYTDPGAGMMVTMAFTQPTAIIPLGKLSPGTYQGKLLVSKILMTLEGEKALEEGKDHGSIKFTVK